MGLPSSNSRILYLIPDTNLFIQCRPLQELAWSELGDFDEIHLIVCRPVQREIDNQKNRGNDRVGKRARSINGLFRKVITSKIDHLVIIDHKPVVKLYVQTSILPAKDLTNFLDYSKPDDEIVGCVYQFNRDNLDKDTRLITHDTGPMGTAQSLDLDFIAISDEWLLQPENNKTEKELAHLREQVIQLQNTEPQFELKCVDEQNEEIKQLEIEYPVYGPISDSVISTLVQSLRDNFPQETDFGPRERMEEPAFGVTESVLGSRMVYSPASDEAIAKYTEQDYPNWIRECEYVFSNLHETLQQGNQQISLTFVANNQGTRPANDVLIEVEAKGDIKVYVPPDCDEAIDGQEKFDSLRLPSPPQPPRGRWRLVHPSPSLPWLNNPQSAGMLPPDVLSQSTFDIPEMVSPIDLLDIGRDSDELYYKTDRPTEPVISFALECEQWRHRIDDKYFHVCVSIEHNQDRVRGAIECSIHAENLSAPRQVIIPVRVSLNRISTNAHAKSLIEELKRKSNQNNLR